MPLNTSVAPLIQNRKYGLAIDALMSKYQAKDPDLVQALRTVQNVVNDLFKAVAQPSQVTEFTVTDPLTGARIAWIGGQAVGGVSYSGAAFANLWVGPGADPATAPFFSDGSHVVIGQNGIVYVEDMGGNIAATFGVEEEAPKAISSATNASPVVVTINAHGYVDGDTVLVAGATGNTAINGYRIVQDVTTNTFTMTDLSGVAINGNGAYAGAATATRYYAGVRAQTLAIGDSFANYKLRAFADGSLRIRDAEISLSGTGGTIVLDPAEPAINVYDPLNNLIAWIGKNGGSYGFGATGTAGTVIIQENALGPLPAILSIYDPANPSTGFFFSNTNMIYQVDTATPTNSSLSFGPIGVDVYLFGTNGPTVSFTLDPAHGSAEFRKYMVGGLQVVGSRKATPTKTTKTAGAAYTANEQAMLNELKTWQNGVDTALASASGHGLWT